MEKELISGFVDSELNENELQLLQNGNRHELKELVNVYRVIGETIRYKQSPIQVSDTFQNRLREALQKEYSDGVEASTKNSDSLSDVFAGAVSVKEESVI